MRICLLSACLVVAISAVGCSDPSPTSSPRSAGADSEVAIETKTFAPAEIELLRSLSLASLGPPPESPSNRYAQDDRAACLGERLFFDPGLSAGGEISCASCHRPELHFTDGLRTSKGMARGRRNAPTVVAAAYSPFLYWDGRRDSLWSQALAPLETPAEMGSNRLDVVRYVTSEPHYAADYEAIFGTAPDFSQQGGFPHHASPFGTGEPKAAWQALSPQQRHEIDRAFSNVGKAIGAYERRLRPGPSRFDRYVDQLAAGDLDGAAEILNVDERAGLRLFIDAGRTQCLRCHNGPLFTNQAFHDIGTGRLGAVPDLGRFLGIDALLRNEFNCLRAFSDAPNEACKELRFLDRREPARATGAFKTPSLREVGRTGPYFHDGFFDNLRDVIDHYRSAPDERGSEITPLDLTDAEADQLVAFLHTLAGGIAPDVRTREIGSPCRELTP